MKIKTGDIYREQFVKYEFACKFAPEKILDITYGKYLDFAKSKLLLTKGAKEVWSLDLLDDEQYLVLRKLNSNGKIHFQIKDKKELDRIKFDTILAFNILSITANNDKTLKFICNCLSPNGNAVLSIMNDDTSLDKPHDLLTPDLKHLSKNDFEKNLKVYFNDIVFFSQGTIPHIKTSQGNVKLMIKIKLRNFFLKSVKHLNFYKKYVEPIQNFITKSIHNMKNKATKKYDLIPYEKRKKPLFIIVVCKK